jgi:uncharacterized protein (DUF1499 family)
MQRKIVFVLANSVLAFTVGAVAVLVMPVAGLAYRMGIASLPGALLEGMRWAAYLGIAAVVVSAVAMLLAYRRGMRRGVMLAAAGLVLGAVAVVIPLSWQNRARSVPPIHDITTDTADPPTFERVVALRANAPNTLDYDPDVGMQQRQAYPDVVPVTLAIPPDAAFEHALATARDAGWEIVDADQEARRIEATDTTFWFGFKDDVVIRLRPSGEGTRVDVRSVSRVGRSDIGTNARRIRAYLESLQAG